MKLFLIQGVLAERYNTCYTELRNRINSRSKKGQVCSYSNHLASRPVGYSMRESLKLILQHAVTNTTSHADAGAPAVFVGGRRRNRKKRKPRNGQGKKKSKVTADYKTDPQFVVTSFMPDFEYIKDVAPKRKYPLVTCVDLEDPVFVYDVTSGRKHGDKESDKDSLYNSSENLSTVKARLDSGCEVDMPSDNDSIDNPNVDRIKKGELSRTHSRDSGMFDDVIDDTSYDVTTANGQANDNDHDDIIDDDASDDVSTDDVAAADESETDEGLISCSDTISQAESVQNVSDVENCNVDDVIDNVTSLEKEERAILDEFEEQFEEIDLNEEKQDIIEIGDGYLPLSEELAQAEVSGLKTDDPVARDAEMVSMETESGVAPSQEGDVARKGKDDIGQLSGPDRFLKLEEEEDDIIFDLSQLELNNCEGELSAIKDLQRQTTAGSFLYPTVLESDGPIQIPMDLLIDDDKEDEVLFDASARRDLNITCNPLYEQTLKEEENDKFSLKSFQSGFQTNFDNVNFIQIPTTSASKPSKESSPLIKNRSSESADEVACCVIL
ncbi:uncharacterized protein LOC128218591 [Mya arenaria]|uniref:uncharacterized protein LOC128218591 n=1 Tax=Mya arenaria TaxID=6604 RepID=UPI0022E8A061|nr:uncharacterized protein LOC128218591 [Mya arenaria]